MGHTIYTVGHGTVTFAELAELMADHRIDTIVDIRSQPHSSRAPDFTKRSLERLAPVAGLGYRWLGRALGGRPTDPALSKADGTVDWTVVRATDEFQAALGVVERLAADGRVVLLCAESDPAHCHRSGAVAEDLGDRGHDVVHLLWDGGQRPHHRRLDFDT